MLNHQFAHLVHVPFARRQGDLPVDVGIGFTETPVFGPGGAVAENNQLANHFVDEFAGKPQKRIGVRGGQNVVKIDILAPLDQHVFRARHGIAARDAVLQGGEVGLGQVRHRTRRQFGLQQPACCINVFNRHVLEKQVVLQQLQRAVQRHLDDRAPAGRAGRNLHQPLHFERFQRFADRALADFELDLQLALAGQPVARVQVLVVDQALDFFSHQIRAFQLIDLALGGRRGGRCHGCRVQFKIQD